LTFGYEGPIFTWQNFSVMTNSLFYLMMINPEFPLDGDNIEVRLINMGFQDKITFAVCVQRRWGILA